MVFKDSLPAFFERRADFLACGFERLAFAISCFAVKYNKQLFNNFRYKVLADCVDLAAPYRACR